MSTQQEPFSPTGLIQHIVLLGFVSAGSIIAYLSSPSEAPTPPSKIVFQPTDGCFYEQTLQPQALKRLERACASEQEVAAFKAGKTSGKLVAQLKQDAASYSQQQQAYLTELAQFNEAKDSPYAAFAQNVKPFFDFTDKWSPSAIIGRLI